MIHALLLTAAFAAYGSFSDSLARPAQDQPRVLVFTKAAGFRHSSIGYGAKAVKALGVEHGFGVDTTSDAAKFVTDTLRKYAAVIFICTTGDILNAEQQAAFEGYIRSGGGYVGTHAAADAEYEWAWYGQLVGGYFAGHPAIQKATLRVVDKNHESTRHLDDTWIRTDEWYNYKNFNKDVTVLLKLDESTYQGGNMGADHPIAWYHEFDGGRAFYTGSGHTDETYFEPRFVNHLLGGILYAMGDKAPRRADGK